MNTELQKSTRIPRPAGTTFLAQQYRESNSEENLNRLLNHVVTLYSFNGFRWQNRPVPIPEMAQFLKIPQTKLMELISNISKNSGSLVDPEQLESTIKSIITLSTTFSLQDRGLIQTQLDNLLKSQGPHYTPFISTEVNKALKLLLESNKNLMENFKTFFTSSSQTTNILNVFNSNKPNNDSKANLLSPEEALNLIQANNNKPSLPIHNTQELPEALGELTGLLDTDALHSLYEENAIGDLGPVLEGRTGTEALRAVKPIGHRALELTDNELALRPNSHEAVQDRRGEEDYDDEMLPNRE